VLYDRSYLETHKIIYGYNSKMDELENMFEKMEVRATPPKQMKTKRVRSVSNKEVSSMEIDPKPRRTRAKPDIMEVESVAPSRVMARASRARKETHMDLPLEHTPSAASEETGQRLVRQVRSVLDKYRKVREDLPVFHDAMKVASDLVVKEEDDKVDKILKDHKPTYEKLVVISEVLTDVVAVIAGYIVKVEARQLEATGKPRASLGKLLSFFYKHQSELHKIYNDVTHFMPIAQGAYDYKQRRDAAKKEERAFNALMNSIKRMKVAGAS
jgi:hypothetical protein